MLIDRCLDNRGNMEATKKDVITKDKYSIEHFPKSSNSDKQDELLSFCRQTYDASLNVKKNQRVNEEIKYCRKNYGSMYAQRYIDDATDDQYYRTNEISGTRAFSSKMIAQKLDQVATIQTDQRPKIYIEVDEMFDERSDQAISLNEVFQEFGGVEAFADIVEHRVQDWWDENEIDFVDFNIVLAGWREGTVILNVYFDPSLNDGAGEIVFSYLWPDNFVPEPGVISIDKMEYYFYGSLIDRKRAANKYGEDTIKEVPLSNYSDNDDSMQNNFRGEFNKVDVFCIDSIWADDTCIYLEEKGGREISNDKYIKMLEKQAAHPDINYPMPIKIPLYPYGRMVSWCNNILLRDEKIEEPFRPFEVFTPKPDPFEFWGKPLARDLASFQEHYDKIAQLALENLETTGSNSLIVGENTLIDEDEITDKVAQIIHLQGNKKPSECTYYHPGTTIAQDAYVLMDRLKVGVEDVSGVHHQSEGRASGKSSGRAIISLQEATNRFLRSQAKFHEKVLQKCMRKVVWYMLQYTEKGDLYTYRDEYGNTYKREWPTSLKDIEIPFNVIIAPGSSLPKDKEGEANLAMSIADMIANAIGPVQALQFVAKKLDMERDLESLIQDMQAMQQQQPMQEGGNNIAQMLQEAPGNSLQEKIAHLIDQGVNPQEIQATIADLQAQQGQAQAQQGPA